MAASKTLLRLPSTPRFKELAGDYPDHFSTSNGLTLKLKHRTASGYTMAVGEAGVLIEYQTAGDLMRALGQWLVDPNRSLSETPPMTFRGLMIDSSRNAVIRPEELRRIFRRLALFGYNAVCLYTEDTYEVDGHPEMGYMRGKYSQKELKSLDTYADSLGIEMIPCIQTLAHLEQILRHPRYRYLQDDHHILNLKNKETHAFIEAMIDSAIKPYKTRRIHIGLDESWGLSRGKAFRANTPIDPRDDYLKHVRWLAKVCKNKGLKPMMWGDIVIGMSGTDAFSDKQAKQLPKKDMQMVFWNYYRPNADYYRDTIRQYRKMGYEPLVAPGLWSWGRLWASQFVTDITSPVFMNIAREEGIREALMTMWGDDGHETPFAANYPALAQFAGDCWKTQPEREADKALVKAVCGTDFDTYVLPGRLDLFPGKENESIHAKSNVSKAVLWEDPLLGIYTGQLGKKKLNPNFKKLADAIARAAKSASKADKELFGYARALADALAVKGDLNRHARAAYRKKDKKALMEIVADVSTLIRLVKKLKDAHTAIWLKERRPFGLEVIQMRYGGQLARLEEMKRRLNEYLKGKLTVIDELEENPIALSDQPEIRHQSYGRVATMCFLHSN